MVKITSIYQGDLHCEAIHGPSGTLLATDAPVDNKGRGETFSPTDLVAAALVTCMTTTAAIKAESLGVDLRGMEMQVEKVMSADAPRRIVSLPVHVTFPAHLPREQKEAIVRSLKACPVTHSLQPHILISITSE